MTYIVFLVAAIILIVLLVNRKKSNRKNTVQKLRRKIEKEPFPVKGDIRKAVILLDEIMPTIQSTTDAFIKKGLYSCAQGRVFIEVFCLYLHYAQNYALNIFLNIMLPL